MTQHDIPGPATAAPGHPPPVPAGTVPGRAPLRPLDSRPADQDLLAARLVPLRRPGQWISAAVLLVLFAMLVHTLLANHRFQWGVVGHYFLHGSILHGLVLTLWLTAAVMTSGYLLGIGIAAMRLSGNPVLRGLSFGYVWLLRSVPPLVQLLFWYELASLYPRLSLGVPFGPEFASVRTAHLFSGILAAYVGLTWTWPRSPARSSAAASCPSIRASGRPPRRSACATSGSSAGSCCRRRCRPSSRPRATC